jgi:LytS/YehU family sensor histidine kinase
MLRLKSARPILGLLAAGLLVGAPTGFVIGHWMKYGSLELGAVMTRLWTKFSVLAPALLLAALGVVVVFWTLAIASQQVTQRRLERSQLLAERDAADRGAAEAQLRLLQAQIQPHFMFNTLATLQHWVDKRDERAGPLLRELTGFLRSSTDMLGRSSVRLADEVQAVRHYLAILQARLGPRLRFELSLDPALADRPLPSGLLLTLVENAIEHGLEPRIGAGQVWVSALLAPGGWTLQVDDDGVGLPRQQVDGVGLSNVRQRLQHRFGAGASLTLQPRAAGGTRASIHIPEEASP